MSNDKKIKMAQVVVSVGFDGDRFVVQGEINGGGAEKLACFAASAISGAILPTVHNTVNKIAHLYNEVGEEMYDLVQASVDEQDAEEAKVKAGVKTQTESTNVTH
ncbi:hypothetical protein [Vibrio scophthalmi]|uniref:Uncharacterized protein n=1 Tax=Vibrio scophthalmi LMG 19158 TaxID=870967 RepID=F9RQ04_9VIBR|nr:hypothetical protein [Vibrio scophthalmi]EGU34779.1 hypothetical protein VIS19158_03742 [Vibrio scophthalmi LMG 19158]